MAYLPQVDFKPYIKPYVGNANSELADTVKQLTQRYDENLQTGTALDMYAGQLASQVMPGDQDVVNQKISAIKNQLAEIAQSQGGYYTARPQIAQLAAKFKGDPDLSVMLENKKIASEEQARNNKSKGTVLDFNEDNFKSVSTDANGKKIYNTYIPKSEDQYNYHDAQSKYFDQMQADGASGGLAHAAMQGFLQTSSWQGITGAKVKAQANRALDSYLQTPEGDQQLRNYTQLQSMKPDQAKQAIQKEMIATGMEKVYSQSSISSQQDPMFGLQMKMALSAAKGSKKNKDGTEMPIEQEQTPTPINNKDDVDAAVYNLHSPNANLYSNLSDKQKAMVQNAMFQAKAQLGPTANEIAVRVAAQKYLHGHGDINQSPTYSRVDGTKNINEENKTFQNGNFTARDYQFPDAQGKVMSWPKTRKALGFGDDIPDEKVTSTLNVSGFYGQDHPYTNGLQGPIKDKFVLPTRLTIQDAYGKTRTLIAGSDISSTHTDEFDTAKFRHEVYNGDKTGEGKWINIGGKSYVVTPTYKPSPLIGKIVNGETVTGGDGVYITDQNGNRREFDMDEAKKLANQK